MPQQVIKGACRLYKLCLNSNFTRGRRSNNVLAACIYATCRMNQPKPRLYFYYIIYYSFKFIFFFFCLYIVPYMLIDFADYFTTNVFELGHTFLKLSESLTLRLPLVDPSIYVPRFAKNLNFGGRQQKISKCAIRLVARMKRDWIVTGRRPAGICGAALLIAARLSGFKRTLSEISVIVHLSESTLRKRLDEFRDTAACNLTPVEFDAILDFDDIESSDPPAFLKGRKEAEKVNIIIILMKIYL